MGKQELRSLALGALSLLFAAGVATAFTPPRDGGPLPDTYFRTKAKDARAYTAGHAWATKAAQLRAEREAQFAQPGVESFQAQTSALTGTLRVVVLPGYFSNEVAVPYTAATMQQQLFTSNATGTITDYYDEVSYDQLTVTGDVYSWAKVSKTANLYYGSCNGVSPGCSDTGTFIEEVLDLKDSAIDFGQYDNDGPDGVPNSGDDDGYVDALVIVHSLPGGECGGPNFISHTWTYTAWPNSGGLPYQTNDERTGSGNIMVDDYVLAPALNCGASAPYVVAEYIDIGVFCHELGHVM